MNFSPSEVGSYVGERLSELHRNGRGWRGGCPVHHGKDPNFIVHESGVASCHSQCQEDWDLVGLEMVLRGVDFVRAKTSVLDIVGRPPENPEERDFSAIYDYTDAAGKLVYQAIRKTPDPRTGKKRFTQRQPDGHGGWIWRLGNLERLPYRLPKVVDSSEVFIVEGEKDVHTLESWGLVASN